MIDAGLTVRLLREKVILKTAVNATGWKSIVSPSP